MAKKAKKKAQASSRARKPKTAPKTSTAKTPAAKKSKAKKSAPKKSAARKSKANNDSVTSKPLVGTIVWRDLTVKNADKVCAFYSKVVGWDVMPIEMGGYNDYCVLPPGSELPEAGVCHQRGVNADLPSQWLMYVVVADMDKSLKHCKKLGGKQLGRTRPQGASRFAVVQDPAGAVLGLYEVG